MIVGVAVYNGRVAPRCVCADALVLLTTRRGRVTDQKTLPLAVPTPMVLADLLRAHGVTTFVCGGVQRDAREALGDRAIDIIENVSCSAGEVVEAFEAGELREGYGFGPHGAPHPSEPSPGLDCIRCRDRRCLTGEACPHLTVEVPEGWDEVGRRVMEAAKDISAEPERRLCRLAELVYFCLELDYRKVGVAYCTELAEPAEILTSVLRRFFEVVPVCCRVCSGARSKGTPHDARPAGLPEPTGLTGNPLLQAAVLNDAGTDLNVLVGLCIGCDCLFTGASDAPVTTLFVKDRSLANNPIGAAYSEYHIRESVAPEGAWAARASHKEGT